MTSPKGEPVDVMNMRRLFWAIGVDEGVRDAVRSVRKNVHDPALNWDRPENLHLTLKFLGDTALEPEELAWAARSPCAGIGALDLSLGDVDSFGDPPFVIWLGVGGPGLDALTALAADLDAAMAALGFPPENRPFVPHLTMARPRRGRRTERPDGIRVPTVSFRANALLLMESRGGQPYLELACVPL